MFGFFVIDFRLEDHYIENENDHKNSKTLERPAAILSSLSSISYTLIFAITNGVLINFKKETESENDNSPEAKC